MSTLRRRERLLTFLLLPAVVVSVVVLLGVTLRNSLQLEELRERSIVEATYSLASDNAAQLEKNIIDQDNVVRKTVDAGDRTDFGDGWLEVAAQQTPTVRAVLLIDLTSPNKDVVSMVSRGRLREDEAFRRLLIQAMLPDMELGAASHEQLRHLHSTYRGQDYLVSYWQKTVSERRYLIAAWHYVPLIVHDLFSSLYSRRDQQSRINVVDAQGRIIFGPPLGRTGVTIGRPFETTLYKWWLNATILSTGDLGAAVARRRILELVMVMLAVTVVIAGLVVVFVAATSARRLSDLKSDFVANVSHELKTPLSVVRMFGEMLLSGRVETEEKRRQYASVIVSESERLSELIENLLDFARAERGRASYDITEGCLELALGRAVDVCRARAGERQILLTVDPNLPAVAIDERAVEVAVVNLIDNALKYAAGPEPITVVVRRAGRRVEVRVTDHGPGVPAAERRRIFERFVRGRAANATHAHGSGIGLALVKHIALAHGGAAWVEPTTPHGSTFVFALRGRPAGLRVPGVSTKP
ncbi:MAG: HAMP domain-containing histidine kinase [Polyangiaceae bacterium]|nr:HAMP domain-containing histidine kinase [Polyangiaceae bacterium]